MHYVSEKKIAWIAITGTIASGKSSVCRLLKEKGYPVVDCDAINRDLQQIGNMGYMKVVEAFGDCILAEDKTIDSSKLAQLIFSHPSKKQQLESILHPLILNELYEIRKHNQTMTFVEVPLLYEVGWEREFDETWCVVVEDEVAIQRAINRGMKAEDALVRLKQQMPASLKRQKADVVIENNEDEETLKHKIEKELKAYGNRTKIPN